MLDELKNTRNRTVGLKQTLRAVEKDEVKAIFIARDAEDRIINNVRSICDTKAIEVVYAESMVLLGKTCGIDIGTAVAGLLK
ncbi:MAG: ribosomal L7Ae/L30e/S12e/Gadd45 family protein [Clostridiales bacterium]|nr:ribosomal L7Ae/L30e/S12e/Gadd45 family protein [Clostridiales bacterium]